MERIILFDGICNFCNQSVQFILKRDPNGRFKFASLQGEAAKILFKKYDYDKEINSIILIENERIFIKSEAALRVCINLKGPVKLLSIFRIIPRFIRDFFYDIVAENRYKWFGKKESCMLPPPEWKKRFLD
ncbi:thiol-disulfide oxidoreductase DCC family protein [Neobacillus ginsengisoli]|uniref:DCC family thiol-disulfide oxidoreductase YuxK n=1 Tax=Neobacillus ginsengisoli TaxID=904295 RepID=A0ABT9XXX8_9BACI|nr:thiol-disulfide oxidoreductase DCC family protein [Neobacillus ginsengisoli]MDQ0200115.1 putative DCC family thiol-disulfide oxidoreductase YuxK [Neobacillus ginsengisoli]